MSSGSVLAAHQSCHACQSGMGRLHRCIRVLVKEICVQSSTQMLDTLNRRNSLSALATHGRWNEVCGTPESLAYPVAFLRKAMASAHTCTQCHCQRTGHEHLCTCVDSRANLCLDTWLTGAKRCLALVVYFQSNASKLVTVCFVLTHHPLPHSSTAGKK